MKEIIIATGVTISIITVLATNSLNVEERPCNKVEILSKSKITCEWRQNKVESYDCVNGLHVYEDSRDDEWICKQLIKTYHLYLDNRFMDDTEKPKNTRIDRDYYKGIRDR